MTVNIRQVVRQAGNTETKTTTYNTNRTFSVLGRRRRPVNSKNEVFKKVDLHDANAPLV